MYTTIKEKITEAVARGWCHDDTAHEEMNTDLAEAIVEEVMLELLKFNIIPK